MTLKDLNLLTLCVALSLAGSPLLFSQDTENDPPEDELVFIPEGSFQMGSSFQEGRMQEHPAHFVTLKAFYLGKHEVTQGLWDEVQVWALDHGYDLEAAEESKGPDHPAYSISWEAAVKWCNARSHQEGLQPCYWIGKEVYRQGGSSGVRCDWTANGYRLPTEAEWEKAARGGLEGKRFPWGDTITNDQANYVARPYWAPLGYFYDLSEIDGYHPVFEDQDDPPIPYTKLPYTAPVGSFEANGYGLYDVAGNLEEWCWDWWDETYYPVSPEMNPQGPDEGSSRVLRGGQWFANSYSCRVSSRYKAPSSGAFYTFGFRVARGTMAAPANSISFKVVPLPVEEGGGVRLTWSAFEGERYRIRRSDDLSEWQLLADDFEATPPLNTFIDEDASPSGQAYYQLNVVE